MIGLYKKVWEVLFTIWLEGFLCENIDWFGFLGVSVIKLLLLFYCYDGFELKVVFLTCIKGNCFLI